MSSEDDDLIVEAFWVHKAHRMTYTDEDVTTTETSTATALPSNLALCVHCTCVKLCSSLYFNVCVCGCSCCGVYIVYPPLCCLLWCGFILLLKWQLCHFSGLISLVSPTAVAITLFIYLLLVICV